MNATSSHGERPLGMSLGSDELQALYLAGHTLFDHGNFQQAADVFRFTVLMEPLFAEAWQGLGRCHDEVGDAEAAALVYETGFRLGGNDPTLGYLSARALMQNGEKSEARERLEELAELDLEPHLAAGVAALQQILGVAS